MNDALITTMIMIALGIVGIALVVLSVLLARKNDFAFIIAITIGLTMIIVSAATIAYYEGNKNGCIDAMTGKPPYVLTTQPNGSVVWARQQEKEAK